MNTLCREILMIGLCWFASSAVRAQHGHLNAGAVSWDQNAKLNFQNGADFIADSGYVKTLIYSNTGKFASTYNGGITPTALHATNGLGEKVPGTPAPGSFLIGEFVSVTGPEGGHFGFWESNSTVNPKFAIPTGTTNGAFQFDLSEASLGAGQPGVDPFGHIHGRRFSTDLPGIYTVGIRTLDISTNGTGGGPIHTPSDVLSIVFQGGINIASVEPDGTHAHITFGSMTNFLWQVEVTDSLSPLNWQPVGTPVNGTDLFIEVQDHRPVEPKRFYRVSGQAVVP